ncbi:MAG: hypothetical protein ABSB82_22430, partial [Terriglobia bacterium]
SKALGRGPEVVLHKASRLIWEGARGKRSEDSSTAGLNVPVSRLGGIRVISTWIRPGKSPSRPLPTALR